MTAPSSAPRGEHSGRPGVRWNTRLVTGERYVPDGTPEPRPNRTTRRAAKHAHHQPKEQPMTSVEERVARYMAAEDWIADPADDAWWKGHTPEFRDDYLTSARRVIAIVHGADPTSHTPTINGSRS